MPAARRLAAILAADVADYSRLMGADEEGTHERLKVHRRELVEVKIGEHSGRIVKTTGDGMLAEFSSVVDAVRCGAEVQRAMIDREAARPRTAGSDCGSGSTSATSSSRTTTKSISVTPMARYAPSNSSPSSS